MIVTEVIREVDLSTRIRELGEAISADYEGRRPVLVAVLTGAIPFLADLIRAIDIEMEVDFLALNRFGESGRIRIAMDTLIPLTDRHVILVEDIVDTGLSVTVLRRMIKDRGVASLAVATLLDKTSRRLVEVPLEYRGFEVGDEFLVGYGLDYQGVYRNLRSIWAVMDFAGFQDDPGALARLAFEKS